MDRLKEEREKGGTVFGPVFFNCFYFLNREVFNNYFKPPGIS